MHAPILRRPRVLIGAALGLLALGAIFRANSIAASSTREASHEGARPTAHASTRPNPAFSIRKPTESAVESAPSEDIRVTLGRKIFFDPNLSLPKGTSCASCHDPAHGYASGHSSPVGVANGSAAGRMARRNTPSTLYLRFVRPFHLEWEEEAEFPEAFGGFFWDGRASTIAQVAPQPLLNPNEMGNRNLGQIADSLRASAYADELRAEFEHVFDTPQNAVEALGFCIEAFLTDPSMSPFSSKFDDYLRGSAALSPLEATGLALFDDREKGACSSCHKFDRNSHEPAASLFTDFGYDTVSVPRNRELSSNRDGSKFDLGVCERRDARLHTEDPWFCGAFRTPSLRNVATRTSFMHNGVFSSLREVVSFYATRGSEPKRWYHGQKFGDLPARYQKYVNVSAAPYNRAEGAEPALNDREIDAIVAFLATLSDKSIPPGP
ncbi:MAG TPA: cytochrome c peroxidase [Polyangiaceae bacterium]|jgi:cytochrome c peroxidase|nr:cytochrome c peroxidase [Polyangiaceae bacterium]